MPQEFLRKSAEAGRGGYNKSTGEGGAGERRYAGLTMITITPQVRIHTVWFIRDSMKICLEMPQ